MTVYRVCPAAWVTALFLARGDRTRLVVPGEREVLVVNRRLGWCILSAFGFRYTQSQRRRPASLPWSTIYDAT